eukprot:gene22377-26998_t
MACCESDDDEPKKAQGDSTRYIEENRKCRDVLFLLVFIAFWFGMFAVASVAWSEGDPNRLLYGLDYHGNLCGTKNDLGENSTFTSGADFSDRKQLHYYYLSSLGTSTSVNQWKSVCVDGCPKNACTFSELMNSLATLDTGSECWDNERWFCEYYGYQSTVAIEGVDEWDTQYFGKMTTEQQLESITSGPCQPLYLATDDFINYCYPVVPDDVWYHCPILFMLAAVTSAGMIGLDYFEGSAPPPPSETNATISDDSSLLSYATLSTVVDVISNARDFLEEYLGDIYKAWAAILVSGIQGGIMFSMFWMVVLRYFAGCMAWTVVILVNLLFITITCLLALKAGLIGDDAVGSTLDSSGYTEGYTDPASEDREYFEYACYFSAALTCVLFLITLIMIKRIRIAVACIKVASQAVSTMPTILFFPLVPLALEIVLLAYWILVVAFLYSAGEVKELEGGGTEISWDDNLRYMMLYHLFGLLWTNEFLIGFGLTVIAGSIANFYWCRGDSSAMPFAPILDSGSIAIGSFIVAVIQFIRIILEYIDRKTKEVQEENPILKYLMSCVKYCMWYLEKVMKFINRNAYIIVAVKGTSYCSSAGRAVK